MKYKVILFLTTILYLNCKGYDQNITIKQIQTDDPIRLKLNKKTKELRLIQFPFELKIENKSSESDGFNIVKYYYDNIEGRSIGLYEKNDNTLNRLSNTQKKQLKSSHSYHCVIYTSHYLSDSDSLKIVLNTYREKMKSLNQDTLIIGSLQEFKKKYPDLTSNLLKGDSIGLFYRDKKTGDFIIKKIPVQF